MDEIMEIKQLTYPQYYNKVKLDKKAEKADFLKVQDAVFNLSHRNTGDLINLTTKKGDKEYDSIFKNINKLIKHGVVGYEYLSVKNKPYKSFLSTQIASPFRNAKTYRGNVNKAV